jgi:hypothetical protein
VRTPRAMSSICSSLTSFTRLAGMPTMRLRGELLTFGDERARCYFGALAYLRPVEDGCAHTDKAPIPYLAPVHDSLVADHAVIADYRWVTGVGVQHAAVPAAGNSLTLAFSLGPLRGVLWAFGGSPNYQRMPAPNRLTCLRTPLWRHRRVGTGRATKRHCAS